MNRRRRVHCAEGELAADVTPRLGRRRLGDRLLLAALFPLAASAQPAAPGDLWATAGDEEAVLTWADPYNSNIVRYEFRLGAGDAPQFDAWVAVPGSDADTVEHTVSGLANGTRYVFELRAVDGNDAGEAANAATTLAASPSSTVEVPDAELRKHIEQTLELASGASITQGDLATLRGLYAMRSDVADLAGIEFALNLVQIWLDDNAVRDGVATAGLTSLTDLRLSANRVEDVSALSGLTSLTTLRLDDNAIDDVSALSGLISLTDLRLSANNIEDVSALFGMTKLGQLLLSDNGIEDISALSGLTSLTTLYLSDNAIRDVAR